MRAYNEEARVDWVQFESPHSIDEINAARAAVKGPFSFMKGKLGRYLGRRQYGGRDLVQERLDQVTIVAVDHGDIDG
jgi:hypothetical protein